MIFKDIVTKKTYVKDGVEKTVWFNVGTLKEIDGREYIDLGMFPNTSFYVFEKKPKEVERGSIPDTPEPNLNDFDVSQPVNDIPF